MLKILVALSTSFVAGAMLMNMVCKAPAQSMAPEVRIIVVKPTREVQVFDQMRALRKQEKEAAKQYLRDQKAAIRSANQERKLEDRAYEKKLRAQKKEWGTLN